METPFLFTEDMNKKIEEFKQKHDKCYRNKEHGIWGYTLHITTSGIGECMTIKCDNCGEEADVTDYEVW
jgi:hypothetical protein